MDEFQISFRKKVERFFFEYVVEISVFTGLFLLLLMVLYPTYEGKVVKSQITQSYKQIHSLVEALQIYSLENPDSRAFPPASDGLMPGIFLCPIRENDNQTLQFLTTPQAYLESVPADPFISQTTQADSIQTPVVLHWVKIAGRSLDNATDYNHVAWGALSVGPSLHLPHRYDISVFRLVPYEVGPLYRSLYNPTNGLHSMGFIYRDTMGNASPVSKDST